MNALDKTRQNIHDERVIAGLFREALFQSRTVQIEFNSTWHNTLIIDIEEPSAHEKNINRYLIFGPFTKSTPKTIPVKFRCGFQRYQAYWDGEVFYNEKEQMYSPLPKVITIENSRTGSRLKLDKEQVQGSAILVSTGPMLCEGFLKINEISASGLAGTLQVIREFPIQKGTKIIGKVPSKNGSILVNGQVVNASILEDTSLDQAEHLYKIGIHNSLSANPASLPQSQERRRDPRVDVQLQIEIQSPFQSNYRIQFQISNASCSGFLGKFVNTADAILFPLGCVGSFWESSLHIKVVHIDNEQFRFELIGGSSKERMEWLKILSPFQNPNTATSTPTGLEILELFCESGAAATGYLKQQKRFADDFINHYSTLNTCNGWIHRWIERTIDGKVRGHIGAVRISDQTWHIGDIAGMASSEQKISSHFLPRFMGYFRDFALATSPCPSVLFSWIEGHPYWHEWENDLKTKGNNDVLGFAKVGYTRLPHSRSHQLNFEFEPQTNWIHANNFELIKKIRQKLENMGMLFMIDAFDFSERTFGSPILTESIQSNGLPFSRSYCLIKIQKHEFFVCFQSFPKGSSPLKTPDVPWIFPLQIESINFPLEDLLLLVKNTGLLAGYNFPGIIFVTNNYPTLCQFNKLMLCTLMHPEGMSTIYNKRSRK